MRFDSSWLLEVVREKLSEKNLDALLVSSQANRFYLTGWLGDIESGYLLITQKDAFIITDSRYSEEAGSVVTGFQIREYGFENTFWEKLFQETKLRRVGFEVRDLTVFQLKNLRQKSKVRFLPTENIVEEIRSVKTSREISLIKKAVEISGKSFEYILGNLEIGQTEKQVAWELEKFMRSKGASKNAWDPFIVASGKNSSKIHYAAGDKRIRRGDQLIIDWGCFYKGYCSDISRVIFLGSPNSKQVEVYNLVLEAQKKALDNVEIGAQTKKVDIEARNFIKKNTKDYFNHAVGHGIGIEVHELPRINRNSKDRFERGNIFTIEPGIYIPGWGGVRIEDMFFLDKAKPVLLTKTTKKLEDVIVD